MGEQVYFVGFHDILQRADKKRKAAAVTVQRLGKSLQLEPLLLDVPAYARRLCELLETACPVLIDSGTGTYLEVNYG